MTAIDRRPARERTVFSRAVAILAAFADPPAAALTLTDLAERTALPISTVHRICGQLSGERMLERMPMGGYRIGLRLWELGTLAPRSHGLRELALPYLEDLYEVTRQHVQLLVLDGGEAVVVERLSAKSAVRLKSRAGGRLPVHATSGGVVMLAYASEAVRRSVLAFGLEAHTPATITTEEDLLTATASVLQHGWLALPGHLTEGAVSIAAPILVRPDTALVPALLTTAKAIARAVAAAPGPQRGVDPRRPRPAEGLSTSRPVRSPSRRTSRD